MNLQGLNKHIVLIALMFIATMTSCLKDKSSFNGKFELDGFTYEVIAPDIKLNSPSAFYTNQTNVPLILVTGSGLIACESFSHYTVTDSLSPPSLGSITSVCLTDSFESISYNLTDTSDGPKALYSWAANKSQSTISNPFRLNIILDRTPPSGTLGAPSTLERGGNTISVPISSADNYIVDSRSVDISYDAGATWIPLSGPSLISSSTNISFPLWDTPNAMVRMVVRDVAENSSIISTGLFTIDSTAPALSINDLPIYVAGGSSQSVTFASSDLNGMASTLLEYSSDGLSYITVATNPTSPYTWTVPTGETSTGRLRFSGIDNAGNSTVLNTANFTIDSTAPTANLTNLPSLMLGGSNQNITWTASDASGIANAALEYAADGITFTSINTSATSPYTWSLPADDTSASKVRLTITDNAGNTTAVISNAFAIDSTAPAASITDLAAVIKGGSTQSVIFSSSDTNGVATWLLEYAADGATFSTLAADPASPYSWSVPVVTTAASKLRLSVTDNVGLVTQVMTSPFQIDSVAPAVTITDLAAVVRGGASQSVSYTTTDANGVATWILEYAEDGTTFSTLATDSASPYAWTIPAVNSTASKLRVTATDSVGNIGSATSAAFSIDSTPPSLTIADLASLIGGASTQSVSYTYSDLHGVSTWTLAYASDGTTFSDVVTDAISPYSWTVPSDNTTASKLRITATDSVGNTSSLTNAAFIVDSTAPAASITDLAAVIRGGSTQSVTFSSSDTNGVATWLLEYAADGATFSTLAADPASPYSWSVPVVTTAASKLRLSVTDNVGLVTQVMTSPFQIDSVAPAVTITDLAAVVRGGASQSVSYTTTDANGVATWILEYAEDGTTFSTLATDTASPYAWTIPAVNSTASKLRVTATDSVGNIGSATSAAFSIDSTPPSLSIADLASLIGGASTQSVSYTYSDLHGVSTWTLAYASDGTTFSDVVTDAISPYSWTVPSDNTTASKLRITATDSVGNTSSLTNAAFIVDSTAPTASITDLAAVIKGGSTQSVTFSSSDTNGVATWLLEYAADGATFSTLTADPASPYSWSVPVVTTAASKLRLSVTDNVGLVTQVMTSPFQIDSVAPAVTITDLAAVVRGGASQSVSYTTTDANGVATWILEYAEDGITFSTLATDTASPYAWTIPAVNSSASKLRVTATDSVGNIGSATSAAFSIDSTPPSLSISDLAAVIKGGSSQSVTYTYTDLHGVSTWTLSYAADGITFSDVVTDATSPYSWTSPISDTSASKLRITATDSVGNISSLTNTAFSIDSTPTMPSLTAQNFNPSLPSNAVPLTLTAAACTDITKIMIQESSTAPLVTDPGWQNCSTALGAMTFDASITNQQGFRTLRIYGQDPVGNISSPQLLGFIYDTLAPIMVFENIPTLPSGISYPIKWSLTEASIDAADQFTLEYSANNGTSWNFITNVSVGNAGPHTSKPYTYNWAVPVIVTTQAIFRISLTDNNAQVGTAQSNTFTILDDPNAPSFISSAMTVNGSSAPASTSSKYVTVSLQAVDGDTNVTHFCLKGDAAAPALNDTCWKAVDAPIPGLTPALTLNLSNFPHLLGYVPAAYSVYAWARDLSNNISTNSGVIGKDLVNISYLLDDPPTISNFFVSNTKTPPNPISDVEMSFNQSDPVYIKWTALDDNGIAPTIELYYSTDDVNYTLITGGLANTVNNCSALNEPGTTLDDSSTGCYEWTSPFLSTEYFRLKIVVVDTADQGTSSLSLPMNSSVFRVLAGNVDPGINSSAKSAMLNPKGTPALYSLAVASDGKVFFNDGTYGLLYINPQTGILEQLLQVTGTSSGDLGPVRDATAQSIYKINMDYDDRLLIWDGQRIRRVDTKTEPMQIETIIGGYNNGALGTQTSDMVTNPADLLINVGPGANEIFQPLPNGDIYFQSAAYGGTINGGNILRLYRGSLPSPDIQAIRFSGTGAYTTNNAVELDIPNEALVGYYIAYDVNTSAITNLAANFSRPVIGCSYFTMAEFDTVSYQSLGLSTDIPNPHPPVFNSTCGDYFARMGLDGNIYRLGYHVAWAMRISRYDSATKSYTNVFGTSVAGAEGYCPDGTDATTCKIKVQDFFVTATGQTFVVDNGTIRVIDSSGKIQTLYGQTRSFGDGGLAQDARFNSVYYIDHGVNDDVILYDSGEKILREILPNATSNQVSNLAGNGETGSVNFAAPASGNILNGNSWDQPGSFVTDPTSGDVFFPCVGTYICRLNRGSGLWEAWAGGGGTNWITTGTATGANITMGGYNKGILAAYNGKFLTGHYSWSGTAPQYSGLREFDMTTADSTFVAGKPEVDGATGCPDGAGSGCNLASNRSTGRAFTYHTGQGKWIYEHTGNNLKLVNVSGTDGSIAYFDNVGDIQSMVWNTNSLYYCDSAGLLYRKDYPGGAVTPLAFPNSSIKCYGYKMLFKPASGARPDRLVFPFIQNGLTGIAEYFL